MLKRDTVATGTNPKKARQKGKKKKGLYIGCYVHTPAPGHISSISFSRSLDPLVSFNQCPFQYDKTPPCAQTNIPHPFDVGRTIGHKKKIINQGGTVATRRTSIFPLRVPFLVLEL
jgi:hypothetical protein